MMQGTIALLDDLTRLADKYGQTTLADDIDGYFRQTGLFDNE
jgi:hypothetical protein